MYLAAEKSFSNNSQDNWQRPTNMNVNNDIPVSQIKNNEVNIKKIFFGTYTVKALN